MNTELLTRKQAADYLSIRPETLALWAVSRKYLPFVKVGGAVRYRLADLAAFLQRRTVTPPGGDSVADSGSELGERAQTKINPAPRGHQRHDNA